MVVEHRPAAAPTDAISYADLYARFEHAPREEQAYFLTTQQADEARHAVFFHRFMREVAGVGGESIAATLAATAGQLTWGHREVFSRLATMAQELRADRVKLQLAKAVALYHIVVGRRGDAARHDAPVGVHRCGRPCPTGSTWPPAAPTRSSSRCAAGCG